MVSSKIVTLVTGDRVVLRKLSDGRTVASLTPDSPHAGRPIESIRVGADLYVIPRIPIAERIRLGVEPFNVTRLEHPARTQTPETAKRYQLHPLTVDVTDIDRKPVDYADVFVLNVDNSALAGVFLFAVDGSAKVQVPDGHYFVIAIGFTDTGFWVAEQPQIEVNGASTTMLSGADATVQPKERIRGVGSGGSVTTSNVSTTLIRHAAQGGGFSAGFGGPISVQPQPASATTVGSFDFVLGGRLRFEDHGGTVDAYTKDVASGVPDRSIYAHRRGAFARSELRYSALGQKVDAFRFIYGIAPVEDFAFIEGLPTGIPSVHRIWYQTGDLKWLRDLFMFFSSSFDSAADLTPPLTRYRTPGDVAPTRFLRGPVGPGQELGISANDTSGNCLLCRLGNRLTGFLSLYNSAGSGQSGILFGTSMGKWTLSDRSHVIQSGHYAVAPFVTLAPAVRTYTLAATSTPSTSKRLLSSSVRDVWTFRSGKSTTTIPLLMPSYVPRATLGGTMGAGATHFTLAFDNVGPAASRVPKATVEYSVGGGPWKKATVVRADARHFQVAYDNPKAGSSATYVNLRVTASDARGRTVTETAKQVYRIARPGKAAVPSASDARPTVSTTGLAGRSAGTQTPGERRVCAAGGLHRYRCLSIVRTVQGKAKAKSQPAGYGARDLQDAYGLVGAPSRPQTIAVLIAFDNPTAEKDMNIYRRQYGLPLCTSASGCFEKINQEGKPAPLPEPDEGWALESALDLQMISAACPRCHIVLAEADFPDESLDKIADVAVHAGAKVTNSSYGITEYTHVTALAKHYRHPGVTSVASSGDFGYALNFFGASFPASSPSVVAVGGTSLNRADTRRGWRETAWDSGGSGCSAYFAKPRFQHDGSCPARTYADVAAVGDPETAVAVYDSYGYGGEKGWFLLGGTSVSSPLIAGMIARGGFGGISPGRLYGHRSDFFDVVTGTNGYCLGNYLCTARQGYDGPTGWGTPRGLRSFAKP